MEARIQKAWYPNLLDNKSDLNKVKVSLLHKETSEIFRMLRNLTKGWYLCCLKHRHRNLKMKCEG